MKKNRYFIAIFGIFIFQICFVGINSSSEELNVLQPSSALTQSFSTDSDNPTTLTPGILYVDSYGNAETYYINITLESNKIYFFKYHTSFEDITAYSDSAYLMYISSGFLIHTPSSSGMLNIKWDKAAIAGEIGVFEINQYSATQIHTGVTVTENANTELGMAYFEMDTMDLDESVSLTVDRSNIMTFEYVNVAVGSGAFITVIAEDTSLELDIFKAELDYTNAGKYVILMDFWSGETSSQFKAEFVTDGGGYNPGDLDYLFMKFEFLDLFLAIGIGIVIGIVGVVMAKGKQKREWKQEDEDNPTPWPKRGKEAKAYAHKMSEISRMGLFLEHQMYNMQPGQKSSIMIEFANGHELPVSLDTVMLSYYYGYTPTAQELNAMREQVVRRIKANFAKKKADIRAEISKLQRSEGDWHMRIDRLRNELQSLDSEMEGAIANAYSRDPRDSLPDWSKTSINGVMLYIKNIQGTWTYEMAQIPIIRNETIAFRLNMSIPSSIPNLGNTGKDFFTGCNVFVRFLPQGCEWTDDIRAVKSQSQLLPIVNSDRPHTFKMADDHGVAITPE